MRKLVFLRSDLIFVGVDESRGGQIHVRDCLLKHPFCNLISFLQMNPVFKSLWLVLLCALTPSVLGAGGSCKVKCNDADVCMGPGSGNAPSVCLRDLQVGKIDVFCSDPFRSKLLTCKAWFRYVFAYISAINSRRC